MTATEASGLGGAETRGLMARLATNPVLCSASLALTRGRLRVLAYHGVEDLNTFEATVAKIVTRWSPVSECEVARALHEGYALPDHAVWFTFDDGLQSTLDAGSVLASYGIRATIFVNPASLATPSLLWFQTLDAAEFRGLIHQSERERFSRVRLKRLSNTRRRAEMAELEGRLAADPHSVTVPSATPDGLRDWVAQGHFVGNHTWDHPLLDTCTPEEQTQQIVRAHEWLTGRGFSPRFFAYPNGNATSHAQSVAAGLGYHGSLLFDHALTTLRSDPHRLSRLRISSDADARRALAILSGAHSAGLRLRSRFIS